MTTLINVHDADTGELIAADVTLDSCFPDDAESVALALADIERDGEHICGGGAAPTFKITIAR